MDCKICKKIEESGDCDMGGCQDANSSKVYYVPAIYRGPFSSGKPFWHHVKEDDPNANMIIDKEDAHG